MSTHTTPLPPFRTFIERLLRNLGLAACVISVSLALGAVGYHACEDLPWLDATLNASMILSGMGPVDPMKTHGGKLFAIFYSLFSGVVFISMLAVITAPIYHRFLHKFHLETEEEEEQKGKSDDKGEKQNPPKTRRSP